MAMFVFARFHARAGEESAVEEALTEVLGPTREEVGCLSIHAFRSLRNPRIYYIHSHWINEEAFSAHTILPHTVRFIERMESLVDQPLDVARTELID